MAQIREIKRRIRTITNTAKVTHAMELVAAAKMRKAQEKTLSSRPYTNTLSQTIRKLQSKSQEARHQLLTAGKGNWQMVILLTSDRGLVGGLNLATVREIAKFESANLKFVTVGKKGTVLATRIGKEILASFLSDEQPFLDLARTLARLAIGAFLTGEAQSVYLLYPRFESTTRLVPTIIRLLPIEFPDTDQHRPQDETTNYPLRPRSEASPLPTDLLFEPSPDHILERILPHHVLTQIYQALLEAKAAEHSARMIAMANATDAANDLAQDLTLAYNQARQEAITRELLDIVTAQSAFE